MVITPTKAEWPVLRIQNSACYFLTICSKPKANKQQKTKEVLHKGRKSFNSSDSKLLSGTLVFGKKAVNKPNAGRNAQTL